MTKGLQSSYNLTRYRFQDSKGIVYTITRVTYERGKFDVEMTPDNSTIRNAVIEEAREALPGGLNPKTLQKLISTL